MAARDARAESIRTWQRSPVSVDRRKTLFSDYAHELLEGLEQRGELRPSTLASYRSNLRVHVLPALGNERLCDITAPMLTRIYATLSESGNKKTGQALSATTVIYVSRIVHRVLSEAVQEGALAVNPATRAKRPKAVKADMKFWTPEQVAAFLSSIADDRLAPLYRTAVTSGMRRGELCGMKWADLDLGRNRVTIRRALVDVDHTVFVSKPKTKAGERTIALDPVTVVALRSWRTRQLQERLIAGEAWEDSGYVFTDEVGHFVHPDTLRQHFA